MLNHDGYEFREANKKQYRYKGLIDITPKSVNWTAEISLNDVQKGAIKGSLMGIGEDEGVGAN